MAAEEFADVVARSSLGTPKAVGNQRLGHEMRLRLESRAAATSDPPTEEAVILAVGHRLRAGELYGAAELAYVFAAERGWLPAIRTLIELLDRQGRTQEAQRWSEFGLRLQSGGPDRPSPARTIPMKQLNQYLPQHRPDAQLWEVIGAILPVRDGARRAGDDDLTAKIIFQIARAIMEHVEVQCERTIARPSLDPALGRTSTNATSQGMLLRWRPSKLEGHYWMRVKWRNHLAPNFVPKPVQNEILFVVANACFSAGALVNWGERGHQSHQELGSWHSMGAIQFFEDISSQYTPPRTKAIAASFADLAEADIAARIASSAVVSGTTGTRRKLSDVGVIDPRKDKIIRRVENLVGAGSTSTAAGPARTAQDIGMVTQIRKQYGETLRTVRDGQIQLMCTVRGSQNAANLIEQVVRLAGGSEAKLRELVRTVLIYMQPLTMVQR
jgi:hypothetical protein